MSWLSELFFGTGAAHSVFIITLVIAVGLYLNKIKIGTLSLGVTWILFAGIIAGQCGCTLEPVTANFVREFGLILFVYCIGMEVGPGFFSSFRKGGITLNLLAFGMIILACFTAFAIHAITGDSLIDLIGVMCGAVTSTPALGAAQQTLNDMTGITNTSMAQGYAVAYPLGVIGVIICIIVLKKVFHIDYKKEEEILNRNKKDIAEELEAVTLEVANNAVCDKTLIELQRSFGRKFIITRILHSQTNDIELVNASTTLHLGDKLFIVANPKETEALKMLIGPQISMDESQWDAMKTNELVSQKFVITEKNLNGRRLGDLKLRQTFNVTITRIRRNGVELIATPDLLLQLGDRVTVVGDKAHVQRVSSVLGNSVRRLEEPNLIAYFLGIVLGVFAGMIPITFPGMPVPVRLGMAGGPLIIAILIGKFGPRLKLVTFTTTSANHMLRQVGLSLFLATVGINSGNGFISTVTSGGYWWILYGFLITFLPCFIIAIVARYKCHLSFFSIEGLIAGGMTDAIVMAYAQDECDNNQIPVCYSTVYPLTTFLRVLTVQIFILLI